MLSNIFIDTILGDGSINFILIHNAGGNHKFFTHQIDMLKTMGNVIVLDLPGHGASAVSASNGIDASSDLIINVAKEMNLDNICLVGLNNGATIALHTVAQDKLDIHSLILIDPVLFMSAKFIAEVRQFISALDQGDYEVFVRTLVKELFIETKQSNKDIAFNAFMQADRKSLQDMFNSLIDWNTDCRRSIQAVSCPTLCIITDEHHCSYQQIREEAPNFEIGKVSGSKCWATLEVPNQVNAMIQRFINI
jgi:pimeloyl-ACP methyl ester carboxylesterase